MWRTMAILWQVLYWAVSGSPVLKHSYLMEVIAFLLLDWQEILHFLFFFFCLCFGILDENKLERKVFTTESLQSQDCVLSYQEAASRCPSQVSPLHLCFQSAHISMRLLFSLLVGACLLFSASAELCLRSPGWYFHVCLYLDSWGDEDLFSGWPHTRAWRGPDAKTFHGAYWVGGLVPKVFGLDTERYKLLLNSASNCIMT